MMLLSLLNDNLQKALQNKMDDVFRREFVSHTLLIHLNLNLVTPFGGHFQDYQVRLSSNEITSFPRSRVENQNSAVEGGVISIEPKKKKEEEVHLSMKS